MNKKYIVPMLCTLLLTQPVLASTIEINSTIPATHIEIPEDSTNIVSGTIEGRNPFSPDTNKPFIPREVTEPSVTTVDSIAVYQQVLQQKLNSRETNFTIVYAGPFSAFLGTGISSTNAAWTTAIRNQYNQIVRSDDYLYWNLQTNTARFNGIKDSTGKTTAVAIAYSLSYWTTKEQEQWVDEEVATTINNIITPDMTIYDKVQAIHDHVATYLEYDTGAGTPPQSSVSAFEALSTRYAVCQGYATLTYRLLKAIGIENQIVYGIANGSAHTWNLIQLDGKWYHLDTTWDDPVPDKLGVAQHNYFNVTDTEIAKDHQFEGISIPEGTKDNPTAFVWQRTYPKASTLFYDTLINKVKSDPTNKPKYEDILSTCGYWVDSDQEYTNWQSKEGIAVDHAFKITFSQPMNPSSFADEAVRVIRMYDSSPLTVAAEYTLSDDHRSLTINSPISNYSTTDKYYLVINSVLKGENGKNIKKPIRMMFTTK